MAMRSVIGRQSLPAVSVGAGRRAYAPTGVQNAKKKRVLVKRAVQF